MRTSPCWNRDRSTGAGPEAIPVARTSLLAGETSPHAQTYCIDDRGKSGIGTTAPAGTNSLGRDFLIFCHQLGRDEHVRRQTRQAERERHPGSAAPTRAWRTVPKSNRLVIFDGLRRLGWRCDAAPSSEAKVVDAPDGAPLRRHRSSLASSRRSGSFAATKLAVPWPALGRRILPSGPNAATVQKRIFFRISSSETCGCARVSTLQMEAETLVLVTVHLPRGW